MSARRHRRIEPGTAPGTIEVDPGAPRSRIAVLAFGADGYVEEDVDDTARLADYLERWPVVWVNVDGLGSASTLMALGEAFGLHRLALEDVVSLGQRAKVEPYEQQLFIVLRMVVLDSPQRDEQVSLFLGERFVLTFQERSGDCFDAVRQRIRDGKGRIRSAGPDYLGYALIDAVVDGYFPVLDRIGDDLEALERDVFDSPRREMVTRIQRVKGELRELRRASWPHRDVVHALWREETYVSETTKLYLRDCDDHASRVADLIESYREVATDLMSSYLSTVSNRMNEVMKFLTIVASVFIPLSFIAGVYGMNFDPAASPWNMPELGWALGYPAVLLLMLLVAVGMLVYFKSRDWFG